MSLLAVGDTVSEDEVVCEIETDKVRRIVLSVLGDSVNIEAFNVILKLHGLQLRTVLIIDIIFVMPVHSNYVHNERLYVTKKQTKKT